MSWDETPLGHIAGRAKRRVCYCITGPGLDPIEESGESVGLPRCQDLVLSLLRSVANDWRQGNGFSGRGDCV